MVLQYFVDPMCSWCWGFAPVIQQLAQQYSVQIIVGGLRVDQRWPLAPELRQSILHHWQAVHTATGQPFQLAGALQDGFIYNTEPACRAVATVRELAPEHTLSFLHQLQHTFYATGQDISQPDILLEQAHQAGISGFSQHWQSDAMRQQTQADFAYRLEAGVMGFPSLLLLQGQQRRIISMGYSSLADIQLCIAQKQQRLARSLPDKPDADTLIH